MKAVFLLAAALLAMPFAAQSSECLHYGSPGLALEGRITMVKNPVSTKSVDTRWYINTAAPLCISPVGDVGDVDVPVIQHIEFIAPGIRGLGNL